MANVGASIDLGGPAGGSGVPSNARTHGKTSGASATAEALKGASFPFPAADCGPLDDEAALYEVPGQLEVPNSFGRSSRV